MRFVIDLTVPADFTADDRAAVIDAALAAASDRSDLCAARAKRARNVSDVSVNVCSTDNDATRAQTPLNVRIGRYEYDATVISISDGELQVRATVPNVVLSTLRGAK